MQKIDWGRRATVRASVAVKAVRPVMRFKRIALGWAGAIFLAARVFAGAPAAPSPAISSAARNFLARPLDPNAFAQGLALMKDRGEPAGSRQAILDKLHGARKGLDAGQLRELRDESAVLAKDPQAPPALAAQAIGAMASASRLLLERGEIPPAEMKRDAPFLMDVARDPARDREVRGRAIRAMADLQVTEAVPVLRRLLRDPATRNLPEVARNGCIALGRLSPGEALPDILNVMRQTGDPAIFGSGAYALGSLRSAEAMAALVELKDRFPESGSREAALSGMEDVILATLGNPRDPHLAQAIQATRHLWESRQRAKYVPLLHDLLRSAAPAPARALAVEALIQAAGTLDFANENRELAAILARIGGQKELSDAAARIRQRLTARPLAPSGKTIPVPPVGKEQ